MRVLMIGATGAIGTRLVPQLVEAGHDVIGTSRSAEKAERLHSLGAQGVVLDVLDAQAVRDTVGAVRPDAIVFQATALDGLSDFTDFDRGFAETNRLRTAGTDNVLAGAHGAGVRRIVLQSNASHRYEARAFAGDALVVISTESRGASNGKAKRELGWMLRYPSWRQGVAAVYAEPEPLNGAA